VAPLKFKLTDNDFRSIKDITSKGVSDARVIRRANILNCFHKGYRSTEIADILNIDRKTALNIGYAYLDGGLDFALYDLERPGSKPLLSKREEENIVAMVCSDPPCGHSRWTLRVIAEEAMKRNLVDQVSKDTIQVLLENHDLKPWQEKMWCIGDLNDEYINRMEKILDIYELKYDENYPVVCLDEKPVVLFEDKRAPLNMSPGQVLKKDYEYIRNGSVNVFCAVEPLTGTYINRPTATRKGPEFAKFLASIARKYKDATKIRLVMDNLNTHSLKSLTEYYGEQEGKKIWERFEIYYTPKHGSWLNQAEIAIGMYSRQCLGKNRIASIDNLRGITRAWNKEANKRGQIINWKFTSKKAREKLNYEIIS
jgi:transposase